MTIASLELDNLNLFDLNNEESAAVNGGVAVGLTTALGVSLDVAYEGAKNPKSTARQILQDQIIKSGIYAGTGALAGVALAILGVNPVFIAGASLGKSK